MGTQALDRREFPLMGAGLLASVGASSTTASKPVVSIVRIQNDKVGTAVEPAIDLLGGIRQVTQGINTVMLKPNLVFPQPEATTKPIVVRTLAAMMLRAGKQVSIGEGSAAAPKFNVVGQETFRTRKREILDPMQQYVFEQLGYEELARTLRIPLVNLHSGPLVDVNVPGGFVFDKLTLHKSLNECDRGGNQPTGDGHGGGQPDGI